MNRLIVIENITLEESTNLLRYLKYPKWVFYKENGVFYKKWRKKDERKSS